MPDERLGPDGVRGSCISGIFVDPLSVERISSRSIYKETQTGKVDKIVRFIEINHHCKTYRPTYIDVVETHYNLTIFRKI